MKLFYGTIIIMLFLAACAKAPQLPPVSPPAPAAEPTPVTVTEEVKETPKLEPTKELTQQAEELSPELKSLLGQHEGNVKSYQFKLTQPPDNVAVDFYWVKGDRIKIELQPKNTYDATSYFNVVYLDDSTKNAAAYCEDRTRCKEEMLNKKFDVPYNDFRKTLALDWLAEINKADAKILQTEQTYGLTTSRVQYTKDGATVDMWIDKSYGIPVKVRIVSGELTKLYEYKDMVANTVTDADLKQPVKG